MLFKDTVTMQKQDCLSTVSHNAARLIACTGPHDEQVLGFHRMSADTTHAQAREQATEACQEHMPPSDYGYDPTLYTRLLLGRQQQLEHRRSLRGLHGDTQGRRHHDEE